VRKNLQILLVTAATIVSLGLATVAAQDKGAPPAPGKGKGRGFGRGAKKGPPGPLPRLSDGHPDLTGIWNGFGGSGQDAPNMKPWAAKIVAEHRANGGAEDFEARCLPGGPPRAAPYHTAFFATPKLVLMLFEGNTHMYTAIRAPTGTATPWWWTPSASSRNPGTILPALPIPRTCT
jgi:hypothetical protein